MNRQRPMMVLGFAALLGAVGLVSGYIGPIVLNPSSNQGPLFGIFITGPLGCLIGLIYGGVVARIGWRISTSVVGVLAIASLWAASILYASLPEDQYQQTIIDGEIVKCLPCESRVKAAERDWELYNQRLAGWEMPRNGWKEDIGRMLKEGQGRIATIMVIRKKDIYEGKKPWNRGRLYSTKWMPGLGQEEYFVPRGSDLDKNCREGYRAFFSPYWENSDVVPPDKLAPFLKLSVLADVPKASRTFIDGN